MNREKEVSEYFNWLCDIIYQRRFSSETSFNSLLQILHNREFTYILNMDSNRAADGIDLRYRYALFIGLEHTPNYLTGPCSVLEMMVALSIRCEENIMDDPSVGNRVGQWFWKMVISLGLGGMTDTNFDEAYVNNVIDCFLNRTYSPRGEGGLFTIKNCPYDLREVEIWHQLCWYLDNMV